MNYTLYHEAISIMPYITSYDINHTLYQCNSLRVHVREYQTYRGKLQNIKSTPIFILDRQ